MDSSVVLGGLDARQREAASSTAMPLAVIAPAGSGKTRVLTARIAHRIETGDIDPNHVLCVTFTRRAANELRQRLRSLGVGDRIEAGTFHAIAWRQLRDRWEAMGRSEPQLLDRILPLLSEVVSPGSSPRETADLATEIGWARARCLGPADYPEAAKEAGRTMRKPAEWVADRLADFERAKSERHLVDFDDLLAACTSAIDGDPAFAAAQRWRFRHIFVDEFQDVNPLQFRMLEAWRGSRWDVFVVGDTHQSIYGWNGAEPGLLENLSDTWPALETIHLDNTHRSTPQITAAAASVIRSAGLPDRHPTATSSPGPAARLSEHRDEVDEVTAVATAIRRRRGPGMSWSSFAVLARTHEQVVDAERGMNALGIPVQVGRQSTAIGGPIDYEQPDAVTVSTIHAAKGLEWPCVHIIGCEDGSIPHASARRREAKREEARLLYVAITRAELEVHVHWASTRTVRGSLRERSRSPFLDRFEEATVATGEVHADGRRQLGGARDVVTRIVGPAPATDPLDDALRRWREVRARAARTSPDVVLPEDTLARIIQDRPTSTDDLARCGLGPSRATRYAPELLEVIRTTPTAP